MKRSPPPAGADDKAIIAYLNDIHECIDGGRQENADAFAGAKSRSKVNLAAIVTLTFGVFGILGAIINYGIQGVQRADRVDSTLVSLAVAGEGRDRRLDSIDATLLDLQGLAQSNHDTLVGAARRARVRP